MHLALVQTDLFWEDISANLSHLEEKIWTIDFEPDVIVLPEMFNTGFCMNTSLAEPMNFTTFKWMKQMAAQTKAAITGSFMVKENGFVYNRMIWMQPDGYFFTYDKRHLFTYGNEHQHFTQGDKQVIVDWKGWKFCLQICYDLRFPVWSRNTDSNPYDCLIYVANWPQRRVNAWNALLKARAIENLSYCVGVNRIGNDGNGIYHNGDTSAYDFMGTQLTIVSDKEGILRVHLEKEKLEAFKTSFPALQDGDRFEFKL
jgi:omega-amidase